MPTSLKNKVPLKKLGLYKKEKLCSAVAIDQLFGHGGAEFARLAYPLRMVARNNPRRKSDATVQFLISIPKKRLHHAVDRVLMRRRTREAYRLLHQNHPLPADCRFDVAFVYVGTKIEPYKAIERAMTRLLTALEEYSHKDNEMA